MPTPRLIASIVVALVAVAFAEGASADTITVRQDGTGDATTIGLAIYLSSAGDTIEIGPGTYAESPLFVTHSLTFVSTDGPAATVIDGQGSIRILRFEGEANVSSVDGITFYNGRNVGYGTVTVVLGAQLTVTNCVFENNLYGSIAVATGATTTIENTRFEGNTAEGGAPGGVYLSGSGVHADIHDCDFIANTTRLSGGALSVVVGASATVEGCTFDGNQSDVHGSAANVGEGAHLDLNECLFTNNVGGATGPIYHFRSSGTVANCTFYNNINLYEAWGAILIQETSYVSVHRNIFYGQANGAGIFYLYAGGAHGCNLFWNNAGDPVVGQPLAADERQLDPVFCDAAAGDFTVSFLGPAAAANSACGQPIGAFDPACDIEPPPPPPPPVTDLPLITVIADVPNDEGRHVRIQWRASGQDKAETEHTITGYAVYRYDGMLTSSAPRPAPPSEGGREMGADVLDWDYLLTVPARGDSVYQTVVTTTCDSTAEGLCSNAFFVSAMTPDPLVFFDSAPDTGYSVDNLPPGAPQSLAVSYHGAGVDLGWSAPAAPDLECFRVYRGTTADFPMSPYTRVGETTENQWHDGSGAAYHHYKVTSVDAAGNESAPAAFDPTTSVGESVPAAFRLDQNLPNPFNPTTVIPYTVGAGGGRVTVRVYDVSGRLVVTLVDEAQPAGEKTVEWNGRDRRGMRVASGTYFYRLTGPGFDETRKMTLVQ